MIVWVATTYGLTVGPKVIRDVADGRSGNLEIVVCLGCSNQRPL